MGRRGAWLVGLVVAIALLAVPGGAAAKLRPGAKYEIQPARLAGYMDLGKRNGYRVGLILPDERTAVLYVYKIKWAGDRSSFTATTYAVRNQASLASGAIRARFGSLGRFSLRFRPNGRVERQETVQSGCEGSPAFTEYGRFAGRATFRGERGYLRFSLAGHAGAISHSFRLRCERGEADERPPGSLLGYVAPGSFFSSEGNIALLYASSRRHGRFVGVAAGHLEEEPPGAEVRVGSFEQRGRMAIGHYGFVYGGRGTLLTSPPGAHPASATLDPPAPLSGQASYQEEAADSRRWAGNLRIEFPGLKLPLTGPGFRARLCVLNPLYAPRTGCDFFKAPPPPADERPALSLGWMPR
ncbi:MAG TPA: hypothetical protein VFS54_12890 [Solirubrobacterales bacterium]|nr:hypothetical protein [Solirubrobacterales bacterium]